MISYKTWLLMQENIEGFNLGITNPPVLGEGPGMFGMMNKAKKPLDKNMGDMGDDNSGNEPDMSGKPDMNGKPDMDDNGGDDDNDNDDDNDSGDEDEDNGGENGDDDNDNDGDNDSGDEDNGGENGDNDGDMGGSDMGGMHPKKKKPLPDMNGGPSGPAPGNQIPAPPSKMSYMKKEDVNSPCCSKCKGSKKCSKGMAKEQSEFMNKLAAQTGGGNKFAKDELGFWQPVFEDALITPSEPKVEEEPKAGEVGFAPQQSLGIKGNNFQEWCLTYLKNPILPKKK